MKKTLLSLFTILAFNTLSAQTRTASGMPPCNVSSYVYVVVSYNLGFGQTFSYNMAWAKYTDVYSSKKQALLGCGVALDNYSQGAVFKYRNYGCDKNPGKKAIIVNASCSNCTAINVYTTSIPREASNCSYIQLER